MSKYMTYAMTFLWIMAIALVVFIYACSDEAGITAPDITAPVVHSTIPANGATGVAGNIIVSVLFDEDINPGTTNTDNIFIRQGTTPVSGTVSAFGRTVTFTPAAELDYNTMYTATVAGVRDLPGNVLAGNVVWSFTTGAAPDTTKPSVLSTIPVHGAAGVVVSNTLIATFSKAMDPATITTTTFTVTGSGGTPVPGTVTYDATGRRAVFTPAGNLAAYRPFTATITTGAKDPAGNALAGNVVWSFSTGAIQDITAPTVSFTIPVQAAAGVAVNTIISVIFNEDINPETINPETFLVREGTTPVLGTVTYAAKTAAFTPVSNLKSNTTYTATISGMVRDLAGNTLDGAVVWNFSTGAIPDQTDPTVQSIIPMNGTTGVANNSTLIAVFSEAMDPATLTPASFTVTGPGGAPVAGTITYDVPDKSAIFTPANNFTAHTTYTATITTGVKDLAGHPLAGPWMWSFTTGAAADITAPAVIATIPAHGATDVAITSPFIVTFSEAMDPLTITPATFTLRKGTTAVIGTVVYAGYTATFTPSGNLEFNGAYTATMTTGVKDLAGNALAGDAVWNFRTGGIPDETMPIVLSTIPLNAATGVTNNSRLTAIFSEAMDPATITTATFTVTGPGGTPVTGTVTYDIPGKSAVFTPTGNFDFNTTYTATMTTGAKDSAGNALAGNVVWSFTTGVIPDITAPTVSSTIPVNAASDVAITSKLTVAFSEAMDPLTISTVTFLVREGTTSVLGTVTYAGKTATFTPVSNLKFTTTYTASMTTGAKDMAGNALAGAFVWNFSTGQIPDETEPTVLSTIPVHAAAGVDISNKLTATFSEAMDPSTITAATFTVKGPGGTPVAGTVVYDVASMSAIFTPAGTLAPNTLFTVTMTTGAKGEDGNALAGAFVWTFTTGATPDTMNPTVLFTIPVHAAAGVAINSNFTATFSEAMDPSTITTATVTLRKGTTPVIGTVAYADHTVTFTPSGNLEYNALYTATLTSGAQDLAGNALDGDVVWNFSTGVAPDTTRPAVLSTIPVHAATDVSITGKLTVTFSEAMTATTLNTATFRVKGPGETPVTGSLVYTATNNSVTFTPSGTFVINTVYTATMTTGAKDLSGNALAGAYVWTFTTGAAPDTTKPVVLSTIPMHAAIGVTVSSNLAATFSEAMDPAFISTATFTLRKGATSVTGVVTYFGTTATFNPSVNLEYNTLYTATMTTGVKDLSGNTLAGNFVWTFTTGVAPDTAKPAVLTTIPVEAGTNVSITGNIAATFSEPMDPATISSFTFTLRKGTTAVIGDVTYAGATAVFNPSGSLEFNTLYTATITTGVKDLAGNALAGAFAWTFTTSAAPDTTKPTVLSTIPVHAATGVAISSALTAVFSEAMEPSTVTAATMTVTGPGLTPVPGIVVYDIPGLHAIFTPAGTLAPNTTFTATMTTGVKDLAGNALAGAFVWIFTTGTAPDTTKPMVLSTIPVNAATGVAITNNITAAFSEPMDPTTIATAFTLRKGTTAVLGDVTFSGTAAVFNPSGSLEFSALYTATITTGAKDLAGNALAGAFVWTFTTGTAPDTTKPTVLVTIPVHAATGIAINSHITARFSEAMEPSMITNATMTLQGPGPTPVPGTVVYDVPSMSTIFTPAGTLAPNTTFTAMIIAGVTDLAGNALAGNFVWNFTTGATPDTVKPAVLITIPVEADTNVSITGNLTATFSEPMDPATISPFIFTLRKGTTAVLGDVTYSGTTAVFNPSGSLEFSALYTATITTGAKDLAGNALAGNFIWTFTTGVEPDTTKPTALSTNPVHAATGVATSSNLTATFSEAMDPLTITTASVVVQGPGVTPVTGTVVYDAPGRRMVFTPAGALAPNTTFTATMTTGVKDLAGNALAGAFVWTFTTGAAPDTTKPAVLSTIPVNTTTGVAITSALTATFSEAMNPATIIPATVTLRKGTTAIIGALTYSGTTATFTPSGNLEYNAVYTATITTGAKDLAGNALAGAFVWTFTTGAAPDTTKPAVLSTIPVHAATGIAINSHITARFSEAMEPSMITNATMTVQGPGPTPVPGTVVYDVPSMNAIFTPAGTLAPNVTFTATIIAGVTDLAGNALAGNFIWNFTSGAAPDTVKPAVLSTIPVNAAIGVAITNNITAAFSEPMDPATIVTAFTLRKGTTAVLGDVTYAGATAVFNPSGSLEFSALYTATITTGAKDLAGNALAGNFVWTFTTGAAPDTTKPTVLSTIPVDAATGVAISSTLTAAFSEAMEPSTVTAATMTVTGPGLTPVPGTVVYDVPGMQAIFTPAGALAPNTMFTATMTTGVKDLAGNALAGAFVWTFTTGAAPDTVKPTVLSTIPMHAATGVAISSTLTAAFSEAMEPSTITTATVTVTGPGLTPVPGTVVYEVPGMQAIFTPAGTLAPNTMFTVTMTTGVKDLAGNALANNFVWNFTTGAAPDTTKPAVLSTIPVNAATGVAIASTLTATFSEAMDSLTITAATFTLRQGTTSIIGTITYSGTTAIFTPIGDLAYNALYTATITTGAKDRAGNALAGAFVWTFTTIAAPAEGPAAVNLASAGDFTILAGTAITNTGSSNINGNMGLSPGVLASITGFPPGTVVNGSILTADNPGQAPIVNQAKIDLTAAYNDALGRTLDVIMIANGRLNGLTLVPGLYRSGTGAFELTNSELTLIGGANDVWIFQMPASTFTVGNNRRINVLGGAQVKNIYWAVGTSTTLGTNAIVYGNILADQSILLQNGAALVGRALSLSGTVSLTTNIVIAP